jgi:hypothetical protein
MLPSSSGCQIGYLFLSDKALKRRFGATETPLAAPQVDAFLTFKAKFAGLESA